MDTLPRLATLMLDITDYVNSHALIPSENTWGPWIVRTPEGIELTFTRTFGELSRAIVAAAVFYDEPRTYVLLP